MCSRHENRAFSTLGLTPPPNDHVPVNRFGGITKKRVGVGLVALIVVGGFALALLSNPGSEAPRSTTTVLQGLGGSINQTDVFPVAGAVVNGAFGAPGASYGGQGYTQVVGQTVTSTATETISSSTTVATTTSAGWTNVTQGSPGGAGGLIEFSTDLSIRSASPAETASDVSALAYSVGGYVAYQSTFSDSAYVVIRVPAPQYQHILGLVKSMGAFVSESSNSNDVRVEYTDLNATLASLRTEQGALLRLLNQSSTINSTLAVESQLQQVNQQINDIESQILQTRTLIDYSTIDVTIIQTAQQTLPTMTLTASPKSGEAPLSVTFSANVKGGAQPYLVNYNFGDGYAAQGQVVIHTFMQAGSYNVTVNVTDQQGNTTEAWTMIHVAAPPAQSGLTAFLGNVGNLFVNVVEGIIEVAVVVLPLAAIGLAILLPIQRHERNQKTIKQSQ